MQLLQHDENNASSPMAFLEGRVATVQPEAPSIPQGTKSDNTAAAATINQHADALVSNDIVKAEKVDEISTENPVEGADEDSGDEFDDVDTVENSQTSGAGEEADDGPEQPYNVASTEKSQLLPINAGGNEALADWQLPVDAQPLVLIDDAKDASEQPMQELQIHGGAYMGDVTIAEDETKEGAAESDDVELIGTHDG